MALRLPSEELTFNSGVIALDLETYDPMLKSHGPGWAFPGPPEATGYPIGYAVSWRDDESGELRSRYLPVRHDVGLLNHEWEDVRALLAPVLADPRRKIVMANAGYDYGWSIKDGFDWRAQIKDVQIYGPLLDEDRWSYSLDALAQTYLGMEKLKNTIWEIGDMRGWDNPMARLKELDPDEVAEYAAIDAELTVQLYEKFLPMIEEQELEKVADVEERLVPVLHGMRKRGVRVDHSRGDELHERWLGEEESLTAELAAITGDPDIAPTAKQSCLDNLVKFGLNTDDLPFTESGKQRVFDNPTLERLIDSGGQLGKLCDMIHRVRRARKYRSTFADGMIRNYTVEGRLHCEFVALPRDSEGGKKGKSGTVSGRLASRRPNLQQVPARDPELGPLVRSMFLPEEGETWYSIDYSSQEPRLAAHFGSLANLPGSQVIVDMWRRDPRADAYQGTADLCGVSRKHAKTIRLGILYGMGGGKLCAELGLPTEPGFWRGRDVLYAGEEGKELLEKFHAASPMDKALSKMSKDVANQRGYVRTLLGRRARFPMAPDGSERMFTHKALNRVIQGSAADMTKVAMVKLAEAGFNIGLTVHDELTFSMSDPARAAEAAHIMSTAIPLEVPVVCDIEHGTNWGSSMGNALELSHAA